MLTSDCGVSIGWLVQCGFILFEFFYILGSINILNNTSWVVYLISGRWVVFHVNFHHVRGKKLYFIEVLSKMKLTVNHLPLAKFGAWDYS